METYFVKPGNRQSSGWYYLPEDLINGDGTPTGEGYGPYATEEDAILAFEENYE